MEPRRGIEPLAPPCADTTQGDTHGGTPARDGRGRGPPLRPSLLRGGLLGGRGGLLCLAGLARGLGGRLRRLLFLLGGLDAAEGVDGLIEARDGARGRG